MKVILQPEQAAPVLRSMDPAVRKRIKSALAKLGEDPTGRKHDLDVKRLDTGTGATVYRLRVGDWRASFTVDKQIVVLRVFHRSEGYGWLADME